jgi:hypothetical protein
MRTGRCSRRDRSASSARQRLAHKNVHHLAGGAGIVLWPSDLYNLHSWVFGEETYAKVATGNRAEPSLARLAVRDRGRPGQYARSRMTTARETKWFGEPFAGVLLGDGGWVTGRAPRTIRRAGRRG